MNFSYGVMQGMLSKIIDNKIQAFPKKHWRLEFSRAKKLGLKSIEWTLDYKDLYKNPILTYRGRKEIKQISKKYKIKINSAPAAKISAGKMAATKVKPIFKFL